MGCLVDFFLLKVLLVSRPRQVNQWIFPGGGIEPKEDTLHAASREVVEEAGVVGSIVRCLGVVEVCENAFFFLTNISICFQLCKFM